MRRIKVAHVITRLTQGGAQENTFHTVRLANRDRYDVDLIAGFPLGAEGSLEPRVEAAGNPIVRIPTLVREVSPRNDWATLGKLTRLFRERRYDIVHTHTSKAGILGRLAAKRAGVSIVVHTPHGNIFDGYFSPARTRLFNQLERRAARWCDRIIELTPGGIEQHLAIGIGRPDQFVHIFSGIDFAPFKTARQRRGEMRAKLGISEGAFVVAAVGRLEPVKGFTYLVASARALCRDFDHVVFLHAGAGSLEAELRSEAEPLGDAFRFLGWRGDVPEVMAACDALAVPSLNEGMGRVVLEAGAAGIPVVAARVGGLPDVVRDGETGWLVDPKSPEALAAGLERLIRDPEQARVMGRAGHAHAVPDYSIERMVEKIEALYEELILEKHLDDRG